MSRLKELCEQALKVKGWNNSKYTNRLNEEIKEITKLKEEDYFLELYDAKSKYEKNEHNLLIAHLLSLVDDINLERDPEYTVPEYPDIDVDFLPLVRDYVKEEFIPKHFGEQYVCNIGSYNTYGLKSALLDMTRIFSGDRNEILKITTQIGLKDEDGEVLTWDKALDMYPELKAWTTSCLQHRGKPVDGCEDCEKQVQIAQSAKHLLAADIDWEKYDYKEPPHRNRSMGTHAAGVIISSKKIEELIPLVRGKDGQRVSAFGEGLHSQDLSWVGLVKLDSLGLEALHKIAVCIRLIRERNPHIKKICSVNDNSPSWSDPAYLNDPKCLEVANRGDLKMVFQFDSEGIRSLARKGGVTCFDDLVAYTALYRPGPMGCGMHELFIKRKKKEEKYELHPLMEPIVGKTYGVMIYQEQVIKVLNKIGLIPEADCQPIIKAISKKKSDKFGKYRDMFVQNAQKTLNVTLEEAKAMWDQIEAFAGYGFNAAHSVAYTLITARHLYLKTHYPIEYITACLSSLNTGDDRLLEYRLDAQRHNVQVMPADINKSKANFSICENKIYWGLSSIKGIGEDVSERIVQSQPYANFDDFLKRFGTDGTTIKPIIGLQLFKEKSSIKQYKYYLSYKDTEKKRTDKTKRFEASKLKLFDKVAELIGSTTEEVQTKTWVELQDELELKIRTKSIKVNPGEAYEQLTDLQRKFERSVEAYQNKMLARDVIETASDEDMNEELVEIFSDANKSEETYYGFTWSHPLENSPDHEGLSFEKHREDMSAGFVCSAVDVLVLQANLCKSKKGTEYLQLDVEDVFREKQRINVWKDIYESFKEILVKGSLLRLRLIPPSGGFRTYGIESYPRWRKVSPQNDPRVVVLKESQKCVESSES